jgi:translation initiation factor IF-2
MEEVRNRVVALLPPIIETQVTGEANVLELFSINLKGRQTKQVAGCRVINGLVEKSKKARVIRNGVTVHEGKAIFVVKMYCWWRCSGSLETLKQSKRDVLEIRKGMECGMSFTDFEDLRQDDLIQTYLEIVKPGTL